jgi:hypothetical protein
MNKYQTRQLAALKRKISNFDYTVGLDKTHTLGREIWVLMDKLGLDYLNGKYKIEFEKYKPKVKDTANPNGDMRSLDKLRIVDELFNDLMLMESHQF